MIPGETSVKMQWQRAAEGCCRASASLAGLSSGYGSGVCCHSALNDFFYPPLRVCWWEGTSVRKLLTVKTYFSVDK